MDALYGRALVWTIWDSTGVAAAALCDMLRQQCVVPENQLSTTPVMRPRMLRGDSPEQLEQLAATQIVGLAIWVLNAFPDVSAGLPVQARHQELVAVCRAVAAMRGKHPRTICMCLVDAVSSDHFGMLVAAGTQLIFSDLSSLQHALPGIVAQAPLALHGYHPLTSGLVSRLPWSI